MAIIFAMPSFATATSSSSSMAVPPPPPTHHAVVSPALENSRAFAEVTEAERDLERTAALSVPDDDDSIDGSNSIPPTPPSQTALTTIPKTPGPPFFPLVHSNACEVESESAQGITPPHPPAAASPICVWSPLDRVYACPVFAHAALMGSVLGMCVCVDRHVIECE
ncbi:hypothetical protein IWX48DRAFT_143720 [Phyllosticta citricarpa]